MRNNLKIILFPLLCLCVFLYGFNDSLKEDVPIYFSEYGITIHAIPKLGDTLNYNKSIKEDFKFVFYDRKGKCYCERYINKKIYEKGNYENSLDTLKRYVSGRSSSGKSSSIRVQDYFHPLRNGEWIIFKSGKQVKINYLMGVYR